MEGEGEEPMTEDMTGAVGRIVRRLRGSNAALTLLQCEMPPPSGSGGMGPGCQKGVWVCGCGCGCVMLQAERASQQRAVRSLSLPRSHLPCRKTRVLDMEGKESSAPSGPTLIAVDAKHDG